VLGLFNGQPVAVRYRPVAPGAPDPATLLAARFDSITRLGDAKVAIVSDDGGYSVEASVPLRSLGLDPAATDSLRGDVGVIFADDTGRSRSLRLYHYNQHTEMTADLTTEAALAPGEWGAIELPLGPNLLRNSSFEAPLVGNAADGWQLEFSKEGATARIVDGAGRSGRRALLLEQTAPVTFPADAYRLPDYGAFLQTANGGRGLGEVSVAQRVPVIGGHKYAFRLWYRATGLVDEQKSPGATRGYAAFLPWVYWPGAKLRSAGATWVANQQHDQSEWTPLLDTRFGDWGVARPYVAPEGCTEAVVALKMTVASAAARARVWVDDVELAPVE
jgi:hypothetical protein